MLESPQNSGRFKSGTPALTSSATQLNLSEGEYIVTKPIPPSLYRDGIRKLEDNVPLGKDVDVTKIFEAFFRVELEARIAAKEEEGAGDCASVEAESYCQRAGSWYAGSSSGLTPSDILVKFQNPERLFWIVQDRTRQNECAQT